MLRGAAAGMVGVKAASTTCGCKPSGLAAMGPAHSSAQAQRHPSTAHGSLGHFISFRHLYFAFRIGCSGEQLFGCSPLSVAWQGRLLPTNGRHELHKGNAEMIQGMKNKRNIIGKDFMVWSTGK